MNIAYEKLRAVALVYLVFPIVIFLAGWTRIAVSIPAVLGIGVAVWLAISDGRSRHGRTLPDSGFDGHQLNMSVGVLITLLLIAFAWCVVCGQGGFVCQTGDWRARNALMRDMITHEWPVMYKQVNGYLSYYVGHWMPAAAIGRAVFLSTHSLDAAWRWGNLCLLLWTSLGVMLTWLVLLASGGISRSRSFVLFALAFVFFGGMDACGYLVRWLWRYAHHLDFPKPFPWHLDVWLGGDKYDCGFEFSSMTTLLSWVFNQTLSPWLASAMVLSEKNARSFGVIVLPTLLCGVFPFIGLGGHLLFVLVWALVCAKTKEDRGMLMQDVFSPSNLMAFVFIALPSVLYLSANMNSSSISFFLHWHVRTIWAYVFFLLVEIGAFALYLFKVKGYNPWAVGALAMIVLSQVVYVGKWRDFGMRVIIPALLIVAALVIRDVVLRRGPWRFMAGCLIIGAVGPFLSMRHAVSSSVEYWPKYAQSRKTWKIWPDFYRHMDRIVTYDCSLEELNAREENGKRTKGNWWYVFGKEPEKKVFYRYLAPRASERIDR